MAKGSPMGPALLQTIEPEARAPQAAPVPLVVDLDGTLIRSDLLVESFLALAGADPMGALNAVSALKDGKAAMQAKIADTALIDLTPLPFDEAVLAMLKTARAEGRPTYLFSASDDRYVQAVAEHLGLFDGAMGTAQGRNLAGANKADSLVEAFGEAGFDYVGDAKADAAVWAKARAGCVLAPSRGPSRHIARQGLEVEAVGERAGTARAYLKAIRPHQWMKNVL